MGGAQRGKAHGIQTFAAVVEDHKELAHNLSPSSRVLPEGARRRKPLRSA
jgi:hypothetical protein